MNTGVITGDLLVLVLEHILISTQNFFFFIHPDVNQK